MHNKTKLLKQNSVVALAIIFLTLATCDDNANNTAPTITLDKSFTQLDSNIAVAMVTASGTVSVDNIDTLTYQVNDTNAVEIPIDKEGRFEQKISLVAGDNTITLTTTDSNNNQSTQIKNVYFGDTLGAGNAHTGALVDGKLYTWGRNGYAQTGLGFRSSLIDNDANHPTTPQLIDSAPADIVSIAFNQNQSMALTKDGKVYSWGYDEYGYLGQGTENRNKCLQSADCRTDIGTLNIDNAIMIDAGYKHSLVLDKDGNVWAFGNNKNGQLGNGLTKKSTTPVQVDFSQAEGVGKIIQVIASSNSSYALDDKGQLWGWGRNKYGNLGQGTRCDVRTSNCVDENPLPIKITVTKKTDEKVEQVAVGRDHILALTNQENVYAWGLNATSQVGYNAEGYASTDKAWANEIVTPTKLPWFENKDVQEVYANGNTSYALMEDGKIYPWGMYGESLGDGGMHYTDLNEPTDKLPNLRNVKEMAIGALHQIAKTKDGNIYTWGWSFEGSLGAQNVTNAWMYNTPTVVNVSE